MEEEMNNYIPVITRGCSRKISLDEILYLEQRQRRLAVVTEKETYLFYERLDNLEKLLDDRFYRTLKKLSVNIEKITIAEAQKLTFVNGKTIHLGRESYIRTKQIYNAYLKKLI